MHKAASILLLLLVSSVGIAAAGDGTKLLTLDVAMELALKNSPRLKALHAAIDAAETLPRAARYPRNPELRLSGESSDRNQEGISRSRTDYSASVRVFPRSPWEKRIAAKLLENEVRVAEAELWTARHEIRVRIMELFSALGFLRKDIELLDQLVEIRADRIAVLERLLESSETTASDLLAAKFEHSEALRLKSEAVRESKAARREIAWLVGADFDEVNTSPLTMPELEEAHLEHLLKLAVDNRPEVGFAFYQYREAGLDLDLARTSRRPWLSFVEGGYTQESGWRSGDAWEIRVGMDIPIFPDSDNHVGARKAEYIRASAEHDAAVRQVSGEAHQALERYLDALAEFKRRESEMEPLAKEMRRTIDNAAGRPDVKSAAQERLIKLERAGAALRRNAECALLQLEQAIGTSIDSCIDKPLGP